MFPVQRADSAPVPADCKGPDPNCVWPLASAAYGEAKINKTGESPAEGYEDGEGTGASVL